MKKTATMITRSEPIRQIPAWQQALAAAISDPAELLAELQLDAKTITMAPDPSAGFPLRVPRGFVARMRKGDPNDPLLRQVLPLDEEHMFTPGYAHDPLQEQDTMPVPGLLHKYHGRALLTATGACAIHCRYCFRRHFPYSDANPAPGQWQKALEYLGAHEDIHEVILSGGDPLSLSDARLADLSTRLQDIPHLRRLRIHSRTPVVLPERVDEALLAWISASRLRTVLVIHANHAAEIDEAVQTAMRRLASVGVTLYNQTVLLKGVNDDATVLAALSERLFEAGVTPYYLHMLDRVQGAAHFEVNETKARTIVEELYGLLPGYLIPRLVREEPQRASKTPLYGVLDLAANT